MPTTMLRLKAMQADYLPVPGVEPWHVHASDPALSVMIDYRSRASVTVAETASLDEALAHMKHTGVRCAFVVDDRKTTVLGMLTAYDIMGEKPQQQMHFSGIARDDLRVKDVMQKIKDWRVVTIEDIEQSTVGEIFDLFNKADVTHLPVMERIASDEQRLRGLLSFAKVKRLLVEKSLARMA
jgi:CBS-domain-containing membrane protein